MYESVSGGPIEKNLYLPVLRLGRGGILGSLHAFDSRPETGPRGTVAFVGITAQSDTLFSTFEIRQFCSLDPRGSQPP